MIPDDRALVDRFLDMMAAEAGASKLTLAAYRNDFDRSAEVLGSIGSASVEDISRLGSSWSDLAPSTVARRSAAQRRFFGFLVDEGLRRDDPSSALPRPRFERPLPRILDEEEVRRMFEAAEERAASGEALARRNLALLELLYGSGLRASELVGLPRGAVRPGQPFLMVRGKGAKERLVPISSRAQGAVAKWLEGVDSSSLWLFPSGRSHLSRVRLFQIVRSMAADSGILPERVSPHVLRHAFATHLLSGERTFECSSRSLGMPISRPRRSTPMSTAPGWSSWSTPATRWRPAVVDARRGSSYPPGQMLTFLDFEKPIAELETKVAGLRETANSSDVDIDAEVSRLEAKAKKLLRDTYAKLTPWQKAQVARHPERPHFKDYLAGIADDFVPLAGDRSFADDPALIGGLARIDGRRVMLIGHEKGDDTASRLRHNFGMAKPEGYRKAIRLMQLADRFGIPVVTLVDTPGAFPGVQAEERGQAEAIARSTEECLKLRVPMIAAIVGEGGSGGAVAIATANRVLMFEHAVYSVISPEGCASILWRTADKAAEAAEAMKITAADLQALGVVDRIVEEPLGGAQRDPDAAIGALKGALIEELDGCGKLGPKELRAQRRAKYLAIG